MLENIRRSHKYRQYWC